MALFYTTAKRAKRAKVGTIREVESHAVARLYRDAFFTDPVQIGGYPPGAGQNDKIGKLGKVPTYCPHSVGLSWLVQGRYGVRNVELSQAIG